MVRALTFLIVCCFSSVFAAQKPNVLIIYVDDFYEVHNKLAQMPGKVAEMKSLYEHYRRDVDSDPVMRMREVVTERWPTRIGSKTLKTWGMGFGTLILSFKS